MTPSDTPIRALNLMIALFMKREEGYDEHGVWQPLSYHTKWEEIMPVVEKINSLGAYTTITIDHDFVFVHFPPPRKMESYRFIENGGMLNSIFLAVASVVEYHQIHVIS